MNGTMNGKEKEKVTRKSNVQEKWKSKRRGTCTRIGKQKGQRT